MARRQVLIADEQITPVIVLTGSCDRDLIQRALDAGAMTYLAKPFSTAISMNAVASDLIEHPLASAS